MLPTLTYLGKMWFGFLLNNDKIVILSFCSLPKFKKLDWFYAICLHILHFLTILTGFKSYVLGTDGLHLHFHWDEK